LSKGIDMPKEISSPHEGREQRSDSPTYDVARSQGKVRDFATRQQTHQYAALLKREVLRLRGGADNEDYGGSGWQEDPYRYGDSSNTGGYGGSGWQEDPYRYGDSSNTGGYGGSGWQEDPYRYDPYRYDPYRPEDLDKYENPFDQWRKEPASTSDIYSETIELLRERPDNMVGADPYSVRDRASWSLQQWADELSDTRIMSNDERRESDADPYSVRDRASWDLQQWVDELSSTRNMSNEEIQQFREFLDNMGEDKHDVEDRESGRHRGYSREEL
jgi:hypothetical protein